ncbi:MAG: hypothetical protein L6R00_06395 [Phycisphaerae bacterium]|nr:hypothetical protein [Phycisphaerae bacterium]
MNAISQDQLLFLAAAYCGFDLGAEAARGSAANLEALGLIDGQRRITRIGAALIESALRHANQRLAELGVH